MDTTIYQYMTEKSPLPRHSETYNYTTKCDSPTVEEFLTNIVELIN